MSLDDMKNNKMTHHSKNEVEKDQHDECMNEKKSDTPSVILDKPGQNDVICGRGGGSNNHPGNIYWRIPVKKSKPLYICSLKSHKMIVARSVVELIRNRVPSGYFLEKNLKTGKWEEIGEKRAIEKTSQALRESAPIIRQAMGIDADVNRKYAEEIDTWRSMCQRYAEAVQEYQDKMKECSLNPDSSDAKSMKNTGFPPIPPIFPPTMSEAAKQICITNGLMPIAPPFSPFCPLPCLDGLSSMPPPPPLPMMPFPMGAFPTPLVPPSFISTMNPNFPMMNAPFSSVFDMGQNFASINTNEVMVPCTNPASGVENTKEVSEVNSDPIETKSYPNDTETLNDQEHGTKISKPCTSKAVHEDINADDTETEPESENESDIDEKHMRKEETKMKRKKRRKNSQDDKQKTVDNCLQQKNKCDMDERPREASEGQESFLVQPTLIREVSIDNSALNHVLDNQASPNHNDCKTPLTTKRKAKKSRSKHESKLNVKKNQVSRNTTHRGKKIRFDTVEQKESVVGMSLTSLKRKVSDEHHMALLKARKIRPRSKRTTNSQLHLNKEMNTTNLPNNDCKEKIGLKEKCHDQSFTCARPSDAKRSRFDLDTDCNQFQKIDQWGPLPQGLPLEVSQNILCGRSLSPNMGHPMVDYSLGLRGDAVEGMSGEYLKHPFCTQPNEINQGGIFPFDMSHMQSEFFPTSEYLRISKILNEEKVINEERKRLLKLTNRFNISKANEASLSLPAEYGFMRSDHHESLNEQQFLLDSFQNQIIHRRNPYLQASQEPSRDQSNDAFLMLVNAASNRRPGPFPDDVTS